MKRLSDMAGVDIPAAVQVRNRARDAENPITPSRAQPEPPDGAPEQRLAFGIQLAQASNLTRAEV
jgi:hypothetical protein